MTSNMMPFALRTPKSLFADRRVVLRGRVEHALDGREELERKLRVDPVADAGRDRELARAGEVAVDAEAQVDEDVPVLGEAERRLHVDEERQHAGADALGLLAAVDRRPRTGTMPRKPTPGSSAMPSWYLCSSDAWRSLGNALGRLRRERRLAGRDRARARRAAAQRRAARRRGRGAPRRARRGLRRRAATARRRRRGAGRERTTTPAPRIASHRRDAHAGASLVESAAPGEEGNAGDAGAT